MKNAHYKQLRAALDQRAPRSDENFRNGVAFDAKLIGVDAVARPNNRLEIVAAMRRVRDDARSRGEKKRSAKILVSLDGVEVQLVHRKSALSIASQPLHRVFYVAHDSNDLRVFSFIVREQRAFRCFVFKSSQPIDALDAVRTLGEAFEVAGARKCEAPRSNNSDLRLALDKLDTLLLEVRALSASVSALALDACSEANKKSFI